MSANKRRSGGDNHLTDEQLLKVVSQAYQATPATTSADDFAVNRAVARVVSGNANRLRPKARFGYATALVLIGISAGAALAAISVPAVRAWLQPALPAKFIEPAAPSLPPEKVKFTRPDPKPVKPSVKENAVSATKTQEEAAPLPADNAAAVMFYEARKARTLGWDALAAKKFQALIDAYPQSEEADISRLAAGRLYHRLNENLAAFEAFSSYLRLHPGGPLEEEAMAGSAESLAALNRKDEAAAAWKALSNAYPQSPYLQHQPVP